jgi:hypothetical protein
MGGQGFSFPFPRKTVEAGFLSVFSAKGAFSNKDFFRLNPPFNFCYCTYNSIGQIHLEKLLVDRLATNLILFS